MHLQQYKDMLQLMIDATGEDVEEEEDDKCKGCEEYSGHVPSVLPSCRRTPSRLTNEQIVVEAVGLMMAGYDTTANALAYTSYLLALNPDIQERLQSEIDSYFKDKPVSTRECTSF